jgi:predicted alpha/beta-hydrolase family hydrolase
VLDAAVREAAAELARRTKLAPGRLVLGGRSMGGRYCSMAVGAEHEPLAALGLLLLGYPLHPAGKPEQLRVAHLDRIQVPMLFFAGTRDALCKLELLRAALGSVRAPVQLHVVEGGDHSFNVPKAMHREPAAVWNEIITASAEWLGRLME